MNEITEVPVRLAGRQDDGVAAIETWLQTQVEPRFELRWCPSGHRHVQVRNTAQLSACLSGLSGMTAWGVLERQGGFSLGAGDAGGRRLRGRGERVHVGAARDSIGSLAQTVCEPRPGPGPWPSSP